jgi:hypothetical protein
MDGFPGGPARDNYLNRKIGDVGHANPKVFSLPILRRCQSSRAIQT